MKSPIPVTLGILAVVLMVLLMSKIANDPRIGQADNHSFWLSGQRVLQCSPTEITLIDNRYAQTHLLKDEDSWPDCSTFEGNQSLDLFLSRGEHTHFIKSQKSSWWN